MFNVAIVAIVLSICLYLSIGVSNVCQRDYPMALVWFAYSLAQMGFLWYEMKKAGIGVDWWS